jgi:hypothetical protein
VANRVYLMNHTHSRPQAAAEVSSACLLGANYQIPILWLALFRSDDLVLAPVPCTSDAGEETMENIPTLFAATAEARANYGARIPALAKALGEECGSHIAEWETFLASGLTAPSVQLYLAELWMMYDDQSDFDRDVRAWLGAVEAPSGPQWESLCSQANLSDAEGRRYGLRGFPWRAELAWS